MLVRGMLRNRTIEEGDRGGFSSAIVLDHADQLSDTCKEVRSFFWVLRFGV